MHRNKTVFSEAACFDRSGHRLLGRERGAPHWPADVTRQWDIPIIGMSAHAVESEREKAIATGCEEFGAKPIEFETLVATIRRVLAPHK